MQVEDTGLFGVKRIHPKVFGDRRGFFFESYNQKSFSQAGIETQFVQDNQSLSSQGVLRGLHFQRSNPQGKLVWVLAGSVLDVVLDLRRSSPSFGRWESFELSSENHEQLWIPKGFAHGFAVLSETALFCYKVDEYYNPQDEGGIKWDDPALGIEWRLENPVLSAKDQKLPTFAEFVKAPDYPFP